MFFLQFIILIFIIREFRMYIGPLKDESLFEFSIDIPYGTYYFIIKEWIFFASAALILTPVFIVKLYLSILKQRQAKF